MRMLEDEQAVRRELEQEALSLTNEFESSLRNAQAQAEIVQLLENENKKLEGQLKELMDLVENKG